MDILFLQDEIDKTNWLPHFCKFVRTRLANESANMPLARRKRTGQAEVNTSCAELPWHFCLTHMLHENLIQPTDRGVLPRMFSVIGEMRHFIWSRVKNGIYSVATFKDWVNPHWAHMPPQEMQRNPDAPTVPSDRAAQFCWFLASTIGNTDLNCAGAWFPFCAHSRDDVSEMFGVGMNDAEVMKLDNFLRSNTRQSVRGVVSVENAWAKAPLDQMKLSLEQDIETVGFATPTPSVSGSMSSRDPFQDLGIPPPLPLLSRAQTPEPPPPYKVSPPSFPPQFFFDIFPSSSYLYTGRVTIL